MIASIPDEVVVKMVGAIDAGDRIVVAADGAMDEGQTIGKSGLRHLVVKARATREDFLSTNLELAKGDPQGERHIRGIHSPFYYELEVWDRVLDLGPDYHLGIRVRQVQR